MKAEPYAVFEDRLQPDDWRVESPPDDDAVIHIAIFCGVGAESLAREYAAWKWRRANIRRVQ